jgi:hypothetical protein
MLSSLHFCLDQRIEPPNVTRLREMKIESFAKAVRDMTLEKLEKLSPWFQGTGLKGDLVNEWIEILTERWEELRDEQKKLPIGSESTDDEDVDDVPHKICSHERNLTSKLRSVVKRELVKGKTHRAKEAAIAQKCGHRGIKSRKTRSAASPKVVPDDVVEPKDVWWDVYFEHADDRDYECLLQLAELAELAENEPVQCERPGPWDLDLEPFFSDMYEDICGSAYDPPPLDTFPDCWGNFPYDSD